LELKFVSAQRARFTIIFVCAKEFNHDFVSDRELLDLVGFDGSDETAALFAERKEIYVGVEDICDPESFRIAAAKAVSVLKGLKIEEAHIDNYDRGGAAISEAIAIGFLLGAYEFSMYKSTPKPAALKTIHFGPKNYFGEKTDEKGVKRALKKAKLLADSVNFARDLINKTPDDMTPAILADAAMEIAGKYGLEGKIYDAQYLKSSGMGAFLAVSRASKNAPRLIHLVYKPSHPKKTVAIIGKGLTYDSGGLSLKPADYMCTMKADMAGAAAVIAIVKAAAELRLPVEIHAIAGAAENMIGGDAYKPDDVLTAMNGKTIEVKNTDAEGRLVLADCIAFAQKNTQNLDCILDIATLTGACVVALGEHTSGVMGFNAGLKASLLKAADESGELAAELPFNRHLKKLIKSEIADVANASSTRYGGAITAGLFLSEFIEEKNRDKWAHLDIAGPGYVEKGWGVNPSGASGAAVRWLVRWLESL
jgi:leucyl aminopeptidase